jgi:hypothetical protein
VNLLTVKFPRRPPTTAKREDVAKLERYRSGLGRGKTALVGAAIGGGGGAVIGITAGRINAVLRTYMEAQK